MKKIKYYKRINLVVFFISLVIVNLTIFPSDASCAPSLTRDNAAKLIQKSIGKLSDVRLNAQGYQKGFLQGMWVTETESKVTHLTHQGAQHFASINYSAGYWGKFAAQASGSGSGSIRLNKPVDVRVRVTGIRNGSAAEFTWEYAGLPSIAKRYAIKGGTGTALFNLYDDGWRLTKFDMNFSKEPAPLTAKEKTDDEEAFKIATERIKQLELLMDDEEQRLAGLFITARTATKEIAKFNFPEFFACCIKDIELTITDAGFSKSINWIEKEVAGVASSDDSGEYFFLDFLGFESAPMPYQPGVHVLWGCKRSPYYTDDKQTLAVCSNSQGGVVPRNRVAVAKETKAITDLEKAYALITEAYAEWFRKNKEVFEIKKNNPEVSFSGNVDYYNPPKEARAYGNPIRWRDLNGFKIKNFSQDEADHIRAYLKEFSQKR